MKENRIVHLAKRFVGTLDRAPITEMEISLVQSILLESEFALWSSMALIDQKHSIIIKNRFLNIYPGATPPEVRASLLHDVGKIESNLGVLGRVVATVVGAKGQRFEKYHAHEKIGAQMLRQAGSDEITWQLVAGDVSNLPTLRNALVALQQADDV